MDVTVACFGRDGGLPSGHEGQIGTSQVEDRGRGTAGVEAGEQRHRAVESSYPSGRTVTDVTGVSLGRCYG